MPLSDCGRQPSTSPQLPSSLELLELMADYLKAWDEFELWKRPILLNRMRQLVADHPLPKPLAQREVDRE
jgi:hypothetical protein